MQLHREGSERGESNSSSVAALPSLSIVVPLPPLSVSLSLSEWFGAPKILFHNALHPFFGGEERGASGNGASEANFATGGKETPKTRVKERSRDRTMGIGFSGDASRESASSQRENVGMDEREAREAENTQRLDKLPPEVWEKVLDELDENDLFPLALTCRYFRQKQKELVARTRQQRPESGKPCLTLTTTFKHWATDQCMPEKVHPTSADYLQFCSKETVSDTHKYRTCISCLAAFHGYLPLLQELIKPANKLGIQITGAAGGSSSSQSLLLLCFDF